jgi:ribose transport system permease protein
VGTNTSDAQASSAAGLAAEPPGPPRRRGRHLRELGILVSVVLGIGVFGALNPRFLSKESAVAVLLGASTDGLMVVGMTVVIVCGAFDLSVGSTMAAGGLVAATLLLAGVPVWLAVAAALLAGAGAGLVNGLVITRMKINPFIATLGTMSVLRGVVLVATKAGYPTGFPESFQWIAWGHVLGVPVPVVVLAAVTVAADLALRHARYLRQAYFVGSNEAAAELSGIPVGAVRTFAFVLTGLLSAAAGMIVTARGNAVDPNEGVGAELRVISAVIVGGASLSGGRGTILGSFLGLLLMQVLTTGLIFVDVPPEAQQVAVGFVLILAAVIDRAGSSLGAGLVSLLTRTRNKKVERAFNVVLVVALAAAVAYGLRRHDGPAEGDTRPPSQQKYVAIAAVTGAPYWIESKAGLMDKARELGVTATFTGPATVDINAQIDYVNKMIAQKVDGIIMIPMSDAVTPAIDRAVESGIPVVCADADAPSSKRYSFIGTGNFNAGFQGGTELARLLKGEGKVALVTITGAAHLNQRVQGYLAALKLHPGIQVIATLNDQGNTTEAQKVCRALLQAHDDVAGFGCVEASGGQGAAVAVKEAGRVGRVKVVAMDRDLATLKFIEEGVIDVSVAQRTSAMTYLALQLLYDLRNNRIKLGDDWRKVNINPLPPTIDTGSFLIGRDNIGYFYHE